MKFKNIEELMDKLNNEYKVLLDVIDNVILVIDNEMKKSDLGKAAKMSPNTLSKMSKNEPVSLEILMRICKVLHCDIGDIMEITED